MAVVLKVNPGFDAAYPWRQIGTGARPAAASPLEYYLAPADKGGEPAGRWAGRGLPALGFTAGQVIDRGVFEPLYGRHLDPRDPTGRTRLGRAALTFRPRPAPASMTNFHLAWPHRHAAAVIVAWQRWAPQGPGELAADLELTAAGDLAAAPTVAVYGAMLGTQRDADGLLDELTALAGADPLSRACTELSYRDTIRYQAAPDAVGLVGPSATQAQAATAPDRDPSPRRRRFTKSEF